MPLREHFDVDDEGEDADSGRPSDRTLRRILFSVLRMSWSVGFGVEMSVSDSQRIGSGSFRVEWLDRDSSGRAGFNLTHVRRAGVSPSTTESGCCRTSRQLASGATILCP